MNWRNKPRRNYALFWKLFSLIFAYLLIQLFSHIGLKITENAFWGSPLGYVFSWLIALFVLYVSTLMWIMRTR